MYNPSIHKHFPEMGQMQLSCLNSMVSPPNQLIIIRNSWKPHQKDSINISLWSWEILLTCADMHSIFSRNKSWLYFYEAFVNIDTHVLPHVTYWTQFAHGSSCHTKTFHVWILDLLFYTHSFNLVCVKCKISHVIVCERTLLLVNSLFRLFLEPFIYMAASFICEHLSGAFIDLEKCDLMPWFTDVMIQTDLIKSKR